MKKARFDFLITAIFFSMLMVACVTMFSCRKISKSKADQPVITTPAQANENLFIVTLQKHLDAVSHKDLVSLESTLSPDGRMQLILPGSEIIDSVQNFLTYHREWFQDTTWSFEPKILQTTIGEKVGVAVTQIIYREPERNGVPYFNRMIVSYTLEKISGQWYIIMDHASSIEKSTD